MSTQTEITRLQTARNKLRTWLVGLALAASTDKIDALADKAAAIKNNGAVDANVKEGESYTIPRAIITAPARPRASPAAETTTCRPNPSRRRRSSSPSPRIRATTACPPSP